MHDFVLRKKGFKLFTVFLAENCHFHLSGFCAVYNTLLSSVKTSIFCNCKKVSLSCFRLLYAYKQNIYTFNHYSGLWRSEECDFEAKNRNFTPTSSRIQSYLIFCWLHFILQFHRTILMYLSTTQQSKWVTPSYESHFKQAFVKLQLVVFCCCLKVSSARIAKVPQKI